MKIYLVGGAVRDKLLGLPIKEKDYVVVSATPNDMLNQGFKQVGKDFPVFLHPKTNEEYALARMERKVKPGYTGFTFDTSPNVTLEEDLKRRDLTINAMALDLDTNQIIDPYGGQGDLKQKKLRHVSSAFAEDPVRILRIARFYARYADLGFTIHDQTFALMHEMVKKGEVDALVAERVWKELERALGEMRPDKFFEALSLCEALNPLFPHLTINGCGMKALINASQLTNNTAIRFAALLHHLPEDESEIASKLVIQKLCKRYRVPNYYQQLALMTANHYQTAFEAKALSPSQLANFFSTVDVYRRTARFDDFLLATEALADAHEITFDAAWLKQCANTAKSIDIASLLSKGLTGEALAKSIKLEREKAISAYKLKHS